MNITLELAKPTEAFAKKYLQMFKQFRKEYDGTTRTEHQSNKDLLQLGFEDIQKKYVYWIVQAGRKIGFALCPHMYKQDGEVVGRYLDTRFIMPQYRKKGIGTTVLDLLIDNHDVCQAKINTVHLEETCDYWPTKGFRYAAPAAWIDPNFAAEKDRNKFNQSHLHWYLLHDKSPDLLLLLSEKRPLLDLVQKKTINK